MLRLVLYSDQIIPANQSVDRELCELLGQSHPRVGYIASSHDPSRRYFLARQQYYRQYGIDLCCYTELDVAYDPAQLQDLFSCDAIHLSGGNTFSFLHWLRRRQLLKPLRRYAHQGVLIGVSAGAIVQTPSIDSALLCGDTPSAEAFDTAGIGLVPFGFLPHATAAEPGAQAMQAYADTHGYPLYACPDGAGVVVCGETVRCIGDVAIYQPVGRA
ncbi:dipeptidase E [Chloroflexia bacterium SDU3-3]|nr:dipeptidase E [Chloroflexia bacterium SDU3-3]